MAKGPKFVEDELQAALDAFATAGTKDGAARLINVPVTTLRRRVEEAQRRGLAPNATIAVQPPTEGYRVKGTSTLIDTETGKTKLQWIKTTEDQVRQELAQKAAIEELCKGLQPWQPIKTPRIAEADLLTLYTMTDCHVGMLAWDKETGADWDLVIAERVLTNTLLRMIDAAPASAIGILNQLGDFLHFDSLVPMTPTNHHVLDADSRYQKVVQVAVRILERVIEAMLKKHETVQVYMMEGNHDPAGSVWLRIMFARLFANNPRITIGQSPNPYVAYQHGNTFLGFYHGHLAKKVSLAEIFAAQYRQMWGQCEYCYIHTGHLHNAEETERPGVKLIQHPTLAAPDAYAARYGFLSKRQATAMTYHRETGEYARQIFVPVD